MTDEEIEEFIVYAMEQGWIEPVFRNEEITIKVIPGDDNPIWQEHLKDIDEDIAEMIEKGWAEPGGLDSNGELTYDLTEEGRRLLGKT